MKFFRILVSLLFLFTSACSTIMKQEYENLYVDSKPAGATVKLNNGITCHTPCSLELERGEDYSMDISKSGYKTEKREVDGQSWDGWLWANLVFFFGFPIGMAVDFYTGYVYDFSPEKLEVELVKQ